MSLYDVIGEAYLAHDDSPQKRYALSPGILELVGDLKGRRVLDLGCGSGYSSRLFARAGGIVTGIDISEQQIAKARRRERTAPLGIKYRVADMQRFGQELGEFDVVTAYLSLHYARNSEELEQIVRNVAAVLRPGGLFAAIINNPLRPFGGSPELGAQAMPAKRTNPADGDEVRVAVYHEGSVTTTFTVHHYSQETYNRLLQAAGFSEVTWREPTATREGIERYGNDIWREPSTILLQGRMKQ